MKIIYLNCIVTKINEYVNGHCSCEHYLSYSENKAWKKIQDCTGTLHIIFTFAKAVFITATIIRIFVKKDSKTLTTYIPKE